MGSWVSRLRKKTSTVEVLECLEKEIASLERSKRTDLESQRRVVGSLIIYSVLIYVTCAVLLYFYLMPKQWFHRFLSCLPMIAFPLLVWLLKRFLHWFYVKRIRRNDDALERLKAKKKQLLEEIMEKETYKKAKEILDKFDVPVPQEQTSSSMNTADSPSREGLRHRSAGSQSPSPMTAAGTLSQHGETTVQAQQMSPTRFQTMPGSSLPKPPPGPPLPRPILPRQRSMLDRLMEYLIGDGPQNRFALICAECQSHNGMALREEFEYIGFRCCYCYHVNEARKQRPRAPSLSEPSASTTLPPTQPGAAVSESTDDDVSTTQDVLTDHPADQQQVLST